jgi:hypothetical protein
VGGDAARESFASDAASLSPISVTCGGIGRRHHLVKSTRERAEEKRQEKLEMVREQVQSGSLKIRQMTEEERQRYPQVPPRPRSRSAW